MPTQGRRVLVSVLVTVLSIAAGEAAGQDESVSPRPELYAELKAFRLDGGIQTVDNLLIQRDRVELTFTGTFYFQAPINGRVHGAVFIGEGRFHSDVPDTVFDRGQVERIIGSEEIDSDFRTAVIRFSDDTFEYIGPASEGVSVEEAVELAEEFELEFLRETGVNVSSRLALSVLNGEDPGFFLAEFDGGRLDRFSFLLDHQGRIPSMHFLINGGEKGLVFFQRRRPLRQRGLGGLLFC